MSISNLEAGGAPFDPAVIAQMANEFFAALPGRPAPPPGLGVASAPPATPPVEVGALPVAPAIPPSSAIGPPSEGEFRSLPATVSGATLRPPQAGLTPSALLGPYDFRPELIPDAGAMTLPGGGVASAPPVTPPVEAGALSAAPAVAPASTFAPPTEAELRSLPASLASPAPVSPGMPGTSGSSFYFLDYGSPPPEPVFPNADYDFHPDRLPDLGLVAGPYDPRVDRRDFPG
jgi:cysteine desulfurase/selenocysteine lyase